MGKISQVSSKYIVHSRIEIEGVVDRPDVIGAIFGQTEGLLGSDLELRELQRSGRIGRIEVNVDTRSGKTQGSIIVPSSLDKAETSIIGAALEIIQRIGPCNAKIKVQHIEDVRISKRNYVIERAKELLKQMMDDILPDSQEIADEVSHSVRVMEIREYGKDRLPAGPAIDESDDVIVVEGRADVLNMLKHGFKNVIGINGTSVPQTLIDLSKKKELTVFVDGDRGGNLILKEILGVAEIDFVTRAPDGKEVEEITKKEIHKALRGRITSEQAKLEMADTSNSIRKPVIMRPLPAAKQQPLRPAVPLKAAAATSVVQPLQPQRPAVAAPPVAPRSRSNVDSAELTKLKAMLEEMVGTRGASLLDNKMNLLGKVPTSELATTIKSLNTGIYAIIFDGTIDKPIAQMAERANVKHLVAMSSEVKPFETSVNLITAN
jgi:DNA primase